MPLVLRDKPSGPDRIFNGILAGSSGMVLAHPCCDRHLPLSTTAQPRFAVVEDSASSPISPGRPIPVISGCCRYWWDRLAIALIGVAIATPVSICTALMINEYAPRAFRPVLTAVIDMLATVPSIVYGFWGLAIISPGQAAIRLVG